VFLIDFGCATSVSQDGVHADLARLAQTAAPHVPRFVEVSARGALARGRTRLARFVLHAFAPRVVRRRAKKALVALAIVGATPLAGFAFGRWISTPAWRAAGASEATQLGDELGFLANTGRLVRATVGPSGRLETVSLDIREYDPEPIPPSTPFAVRKLQYFRFLPDGGVDWKFKDESRLLMDEEELRRRFPAVIPAVDDQ
jgi:hypothetical protein